MSSNRARMTARKWKAANVSRAYALYLPQSTEIIEWTEHLLAPTNANRICAVSVSHAPRTRMSPLPIAFTSMEGIEREKKSNKQPCCRRTKGLWCSPYNANNLSKLILNDLMMMLVILGHIRTWLCAVSTQSCPLYQANISFCYLSSPSLSFSLALSPSLPFSRVRLPLGSLSFFFLSSSRRWKCAANAVICSVWQLYLSSHLYLHFDFVARVFGCISPTLHHVLLASPPFCPRALLVWHVCDRVCCGPQSALPRFAFPGTVVSLHRLGFVCICLA